MPTRIEHNRKHHTCRNPEEFVSCNCLGYGEGDQYDPACPCCYLGHPHTWREHDRHIEQARAVERARRRPSCFNCTDAAGGSGGTYCHRDGRHHHPDGCCADYEPATPRLPQLWRCHHCAGIVVPDEVGWTCEDERGNVIRYCFDCWRLAAKHTAALVR